MENKTDWMLAMLTASNIVAMSEGTSSGGYITMSNGPTIEEIRLDKVLNLANKIYKTTPNK